MAVHPCLAALHRVGQPDRADQLQPLAAVDQHSHGARLRAGQRDDGLEEALEQCAQIRPLGQSGGDLHEDLRAGRP